MIAIIDYGMGNLRSVSKALEYLGATYKLCTKASDLLNSKKVILPGVGAFGDAMRELQDRRLIEPIQELVRRKIKMMGVCLGLQLLFEKSEEASDVKGLGILKGCVVRFRLKNAKIPHMGWNDLTLKQPHPLLEGIQNGDYFYFVHSYYAKPKSGFLTLATCQYGKKKFPAIVGKENIFATQFHPEKSQAVGLQILKNFIKW